MKAPGEDLVDRVPVWNCLQTFWLDTDPAVFLAGIARVCAESKYTLDELEAIFWNEVRPAVEFNLGMFLAPEWAGFEITWLTQRILRRSRYGKPLPRGWLHPYSCGWWRRLRAEILRCRSDSACSLSIR